MAWYASSCPCAPHIWLSASHRAPPERTRTTCADLLTSICGAHMNSVWVLRRGQQPARLAFFRPVVLTVKTKLAFHLLKVFLLLVTQSIQLPGLHCGHVHPKCRYGVEAWCPAGIADFLLIERELFYDTCIRVIINCEPLVYPFYCFTVASSSSG